MFNVKNALKLTAVAGLLALSTTSFAADKLKLVVGTEAGYAPYEYLTKEGKIEGFDIDLINKVCSMIDAECEIKDFTFDTLIPSVKAKKIDLVIAGVNPTEQRRKIVAFSNSYLDDFKYTYLVSADSPLTSITEPKKVGYQAGTVAQKYIATKTTQTGIPYTNFDLAFTDLKSKRLDAVLLALDTAVEWTKNKEFKYLGEPLEDKQIFGEGPAIMVNKNNTELLAKINKALDELKANGFIHELQVKYNLQLSK